jgi:predicted phage-related endonuclease
VSSPPYEQNRPRRTGPVHAQPTVHQAPHSGSTRTATDSSRVDLDEQAIELVGELRELREINKRITAREQEVRARLLEALDGADNGCVDGTPVIRADRVSQRRVDVQKLKVEFPDVHDWCQRTVEYVTLRLP